MPFMRHRLSRENCQAMNAPGEQELRATLCVEGWEQQAADDRSDRRSDAVDHIVRDPGVAAHEPAGVAAVEAGRFGRLAASRARIGRLDRRAGQGVRQ